MTCYSATALGQWLSQIDSFLGCASKTNEGAILGSYRYSARDSAQKIVQEPFA